MNAAGKPAPLRIALLTLESLASARAVRRFVAAHAGEIALVGLSDPFRPEAGGAFGQTWRRLRHSGPRILPYLLANFALPQAVGRIARPRAGTVDDMPLRHACRNAGIPAVTVRDVNGQGFRQALAESGAELLVTFHFDQILSAETIASVPAGGVNVHPGLLPRHRGPTPTIHALLDEPVAFGVTIHRLTARIDAGALLAQAAMADAPGLTAIGAARRLHEAALPLLDDVLRALATGSAVETELPPGRYQGFPTGAELGRLARAGRKAADLADVRAALATPV